MPAILSAAAPEYLSGVVTGIWAIYLLALGGATWQVGLSYTAFALPSVVLSVWFGTQVDRGGGRPVMTASLIAMAAILPLFVVVSSPVMLILVLALAGVALAAEKPVVYSEVTLVSSPSEYARSQSVLQIGLMVSQSVGAILSGFMFAASPALVFPSIAVICVLSLLAVPHLQRRPAAATA
jgi:MFS family permease